MSRQFAKSTDYLSRTDVMGATAYPISASCHFCADDVTQIHPLMAFSKNGGTDDSLIAWLRGDAAGDYVAVRAAQNAAATFEATNSSTSITAGVWYHMLAVWESATLRHIAINGVRVSSNGATSVVWPSGMDRTGIGAVFRSATTVAAAKIAYPCWWNVAITAAEGWELAAGVDPSQIRPASILEQWDCRRACSPEPGRIATYDLTVTGTCATSASDPTITRNRPILLPRNAWSARIMANSPYTTYQYKSASVTSGAALALSDFGFSASEIAKAKCAIISVLTGNVMMSRLSGLTATSTVGELVLANTAIMVEGATDVQAINMIAQGTTATVTIFLQN